MRDPLVMRTVYMPHAENEISQTKSSQIPDKQSTLK